MTKIRAQAHTARGAVAAPTRRSRQAGRRRPPGLAPLARVAAAACLGVAANTALACAGAGLTTITGPSNQTCDLQAGDSLNVASSGSITVGTDGNGYPLAAITTSGQAATVTNNGQINSYIFVAGFGNGVTTIHNAGTIAVNLGAITSLDGAIEITSNGSISGIHNTGTIHNGAYDGIGLYLVANPTSSISNTDGGNIIATLAGNAGIWVGFATVDNITNGVGSSIMGLSGSEGITVNGGTANAIDNAGIISGDRGITMNTSRSSGVGYSISNSGTIVGTAGDGIGIYRLGDNSLVVNNSPGGSVIGNGADAAGMRVDTSMDSIHNSGQILGLSGGSGIVVEGSAVSLANGISNLAGGVISGERAGIRVIGGGNVPFITNAGTITGSAGPAIDLTAAGSPTMVNNSGTINGDVLLGAGSLSLDGVTGAVQGAVRGGIGSAVLVNGSYASGGAYAVADFTIASGARFSAGHAVTVSNALDNAGTLALAAGQTTTAGSYTQSAGGLFRVGASSASNHGTLVVQGTANFQAGAAIAVDVSPGVTFANHDVLHIVRSGLLLSPASYSVSDNSALWNFTAADNGAGGIDLTAHFGSLIPAVLVAGRPAATGVAGALDGILAGDVPASMQTLTGILNSQTNLVDLGNLVAQLMPVLSGAQGAASLASISAGASSLVQDQLACTLGLAAGDAPAERHVWVKPFGSSLQQDAFGSVAGYKATSSGLAVGGDRKLEGSDWRAGLALSYGTAKLQDGGTNSGNVDINSWQVTAYGSRKLQDQARLQVLAGMGFNDHSSSRYVPMLSTRYSAKYNSWHALLDAELEWARTRSDSTTLIPSLRLSYSSLHSDAYTETPSGNAALRVASQTTDSLVLGLGATLVHAQPDGARWLGHVSVGYELVEQGTGLNSSFAAGGPSFCTPGATPSRSLIKAGLGYHKRLGSGTEVRVRLDTEQRERYAANTVSVNWRMEF